MRCKAAFCVCLKVSGRIGKIVRPEIGIPLIRAKSFDRKSECPLSGQNPSAGNPNAPYPDKIRWP